MSFNLRAKNKFTSLSNVATPINIRKKENRFKIYNYTIREYVLIYFSMKTCKNTLELKKIKKRKSWKAIHRLM